MPGDGVRLGHIHECRVDRTEIKSIRETQYYIAEGVQERDGVFRFWRGVFDQSEKIIKLGARQA